MGGEENTDQVNPLVRIAKALETIAKGPEVEVEVSPPVCPSCGALNPTVVLPSQEAGQGPMAEIVVNGHCNECGSPFYIVIESYSMHKSVQTASEEIEARKRAGFFTYGEDQ